MRDQLSHSHPCKHELERNGVTTSLRPTVCSLSNHIEYEIEGQICACRVASSALHLFFPSFSLRMPFPTKHLSDPSPSSPRFLEVETSAHRYSHPSRNSRVSSIYRTALVLQESIILSIAPAAAMSSLTSSSWTLGIQVR